MNKAKSKSQWITSHARVDAYMTVIIGHVVGADHERFVGQHRMSRLAEYAELAIDAIREVDKQIVIEREYESEEELESIRWRSRHLP
jgi:hypothetical protein